MIQAHGLSHHDGQTGLVSSRAICRACTECCTPYDAGTCAGCPYAVCHMGSAHGLQLRCLFSVFLRTPCFSVCTLLAHEISHADALRSFRTTWTNHTGRFRGSVSTPKKKEPDLFLTLRFLQMSAALVRVLCTEYVIVCTPEYLYILLLRQLCIGYGVQLLRAASSVHRHVLCPQDVVPLQK